MASNVPPIPQGNSKAARWFQWAHEEIQRLRATSSPNAKVYRTTRGTTVIPTASGHDAITGWHWHDRNDPEYDTTVKYSLDEVVVVSPDNSAVTDGVPIDPLNAESENDFSLPGTWVCVKTPTTDDGAADDGSQDVIHVPKWPLPAGTDDDPIYWRPVSLGPMQYVDCIANVEQTLYVNAAEPTDDDADGDDGDDDDS